MAPSSRLRSLVGLAFVGIAVSACNDGEGLSIGNSVADGTNVSFKIANDSNKSADVLMWIEQGDLRFCEFITEVEARRTYNIRFVCLPLKSGRLLVRAAWASTRRDRAVVAERIK